jgi:hypothetical protein
LIARVAADLRRNRPFVEVRSSGAATPKLPFAAGETSAADYYGYRCVMPCQILSCGKPG